MSVFFFFFSCKAGWLASRDRHTRMGRQRDSPQTLSHNYKAGNPPPAAHDGIEIFAGDIWLISQKGSFESLKSGVEESTFCCHVIVKRPGRVETNIALDEFLDVMLLTL